jgi:hypothetical protein
MLSWMTGLLFLWLTSCILRLLALAEVLALALSLCRRPRA